MNDNKETMWMMQQDFKESQHRENYRRAEAFLVWKMGGPVLDDLRRQFRGAPFGDLESLLVEFCEKVEEDLLARTRYIEELHWKTETLRINTSVMPTPFVYPEAEKKQ